MALTVLNASNRSDTKTLLTDLLKDSESSRVHHLREARFAPCVGCFRCWLKHPGSCSAADHANAVMRDSMASDRVLWITRPRFGAWCPVAKVALDKSIGLISPFFNTIDGETHHRPRYDSYPHWTVVAEVSAGTSEGEKATFAHVVQRNTINLHNHASRIIWIPDDLAPAARRDAFSQALREDASHSLLDDHATDLPALPTLAGPSLASGRSPRAVLWVGSMKPPGSSSSEALGRALTRRLEARGWSCESHFVAATTRLTSDRSSRLRAALDDAQLLIIAAPIYVDSLPSLVLKGLAELVAASRPGRLPLTVLPLLQCGFPEPAHTAAALQIIAHASRAAGWSLAGYITLGGGGFINGADIDSSKRFDGLQQTFEKMATCLTAGQPVPQEILTAMTKPLMNPTLYRWMGQLGWLAEAAKQGALTRLWDQPFASSHGSDQKES